MAKLYDTPRIKLDGEQDKRCLRQKKYTHIFFTKITEQMYIDLKKISTKEGIPMCKILKPLFQHEIGRRLKIIEDNT